MFYVLLNSYVISRWDLKTTKSTGEHRIKLAAPGLRLSSLNTIPQKLLFDGCEHHYWFYYGWRHLFNEIINHEHMTGRSLNLDLYYQEFYRNVVSGLVLKLINH